MGKEWQATKTKCRWGSSTIEGVGACFLFVLVWLGNLFCSTADDQQHSNVQPFPPTHPPHLPKVIIAYTLGIAACLAAFAAAPASLGWLQWATVFMIGFFLYGPQVGVGAYCIA